MDEDEMLRRALEESLQISEQQQRDQEEEQRREADLLRQSEQDAQRQDAQRRQRRQQDAEDQEAEMIQHAMAESQRDEEERVRRQTEELRLLDASFGNGDGSRNTLTRAPPAATTARPATPNRNRGGDRSRPQRNHPPAFPVRAPTRGHRGRRQNPNPARAPAPQPSRQTTPQPVRQRTPQPDPQQQRNRSPSRGRRRHQRYEEPTILENPGNYSLEDVLQMSVRETSAAPPQEEGFNRDELAAAIAASAQQNRDEEQEAIDRNTGVPTYQEACAAPMYRPPRGVRYKFQGPNKAEMKDGCTVEIVGEMDLEQALKIANRNVRRQGGR